MMYLSKILFILFWSISLLPSPILAQNGASHQGPEKAVTLAQPELENLFQELILKDQPFNSRDLELINFSSTPAQLYLPDGTISFQVISGSASKRLGRQSLIVAVLVNDHQEARLRMSGDLRLYGQAVQAVRTLKRNTLVSADDFIVTRQDITMLGPDLISDPAMIVGKELKTTMRPGALFYSTLVRAAKLVQRGDAVAILADNGRLKISAPGKALAAGALGETIRVKNMMSRKEVLARVMSNDQVEVDF